MASETKTITADASVDASCTSPEVAFSTPTTPEQQHVAYRDAQLGEIARLAGRECDCTQAAHKPFSDLLAQIDTRAPDHMPLHQVLPNNGPTVGDFRALMAEIRASLETDDNG